MKPAFVPASFFLALLFLLAPAARAFDRPAHGELPNFDRRRATDHDKAPRAEQTAATDKLKARVPGLRLEAHERLGTPKFVGADRGFLSGPNGEGQAITPAGARGVAVNDPHRPVKTFLNEHAAIFGHDAATLTAAKLQRDAVTKHSGLRTIVWEQRLDDLAVFEGCLIGNMTSRGELVNLSSQFMPEPARAADAGTPNRAALQAAPLISPQRAIAAAAATLDENLEVSAILPLEAQPGGAEKLQRFRAAPLPGVAVVKLVWLPMGRATLRLCWQVELTRRAGGERYRVLIDAITGEALVRHGLTVYLSDATYRVFTSDSPSPFSPGFPTPNTNQPPSVPRTLVTLAALNTNASPLGWIADGENETRGNNVDAHLDRDASDTPDLPRPQGSPFRVFDPPLDLNQPPTSYGDAAAVQLFYWCNWMHDRLHELGFDEASGNYQKDNFGRGGLGNDAIQADAQDGSGVNNANFTPGPDGEAGRIQMFVWSSPSPQRDGDFDAEIVIHEYVHGLSTRLVGGGVGITQLQSGGMGEGWSDFYALCLLSESADDPNGVYAFGGYATHQLVGLDENYYFGIRRYPYSTDLSKNPLTFKDIDTAQISPHPGVPASPIFPFNPLNAPEVHAQGEFWCVTLWEARANLIRKHGPAAGNQLILQLVTDGMKLSPPNPNYLQARDAIIAADFVGNHGANFMELWAAFAKRGLGFSASSPSSATTVGLVEAFDLPDALLLTPANGFLSGGPAGGPFAPVCKTYTITNHSSAPQTWTAKVEQPWLTVTPAGGTLPPGRATNFSVCVNTNARALPLGVYADTLLFSNATTRVTQTRPAQLAVTAFATVPFTDGFESGEFGSFWSVTGTGPFRTLVTGDFSPRTGAYQVTLDSAGAGQNARNELTLGVDLAGYTNVVLRFWAKGFEDEPDAPPPGPFLDGADFDGVAISLDGVQWFEVRGLRDVTSAYAEFVVDLDAALRARGLSYNSTFRIRFNQFDNFSIPFDGFALDDISITGEARTRLRLQLPATVTEGDGTLTNQGLVTVGAPVAADLLIQLASSDPANLVTPATVKIPAGASNAAFNLTIPNNSSRDGPRPVTITATAATYTPANATLTVNDNEKAKLEVKLPKNAREGDGLLKGEGKVKINKKPASNILVRLTSSDPAELRVPASVVVWAGEKEAEFDLTVVDDRRLDGKREITVTAHVDNWTDGEDTMDIRDNDFASMALVLPANIGEASGRQAGAGLVRLSGTVTSNLTITLSSSDTNRLRVPASVVIATGQQAVNFDLTPVDNALIESPIKVTVKASAPGFNSTNASLTVLDDETPPVAYQPQPEHLATNQPLGLALQWSSGVGEILLNGGFETGDFSGWIQQVDGFGGFLINDGKLDPRGPDGPLPPYAGKYSIVTVQDGAGTHTLYQEVFIPADAPAVTLRWVDRIRNHAVQFATPNQQFRVEIRNIANQFLATAFATKTGDPLTNDWTARSFDLSKYRGRAVRVAFITSDNLGYFNVHLDNISVAVEAPGTTSFDLYFGTNPAPGTNEFQGTLTNTVFNVSGLALATPYYWQVVTRRGAARTRGPIWQFTTRGVGPVDHFEIGRVYSPAFSGQRFPVVITAKDDINNTVKNFPGPVTLRGVRGAGTKSSVLITEVDPGQIDRAEFVNATDATLDLSGWQIVVYDANYWPLPLITIPIPQGTRSRPGELFQLIDNGTNTGSYPVFYAPTNIFWNNTATRNTMALLVRDAAGNVVDFVCGAGADPGLITVPRRIPAEEWIGHPLPANPDALRSWQRRGGADHDDGSDWTIAPTSPGGPNDGLALPFTPRADIAVTPALLTNFVTGIWTGYVTVQEPAPQMTLRVDDGAGHFALSNPFAVVATNDLALSMSGSPGLLLAGGNVTYTLTVHNFGPERADGLVLTNRLPAGLTFISATASQGDCANAAGLVWCDLGALAAGNDATVFLVAATTAAGTFTNRAEVTRAGPEAFLKNNRAATVTPVAFPLVTFQTISVAEGSGGTNKLSLPVRLSAASPLTATVSFTTADGTAKAGADYLAVSGMLVFPPGSTQQMITILILGDAMREDQEAFTVNLTDAVNAGIGTTQVVVRINNDDATPTVSIGDATVVEGPAGATTNAVFAVTLSAASGLPVLVSFATSNGTASAGRDYLPVSGTLAFEPGVTNLAVVVSIRGDNRFEPPEKFFLNLSEPFNATLGRAQGTGSILDDDAGALDHFEWSAVPSPQYARAPFTATITARDAMNHTVSNFAGGVTLQGVAGGREAAVGSGTNAWPQPMGALYHDARTQVIYLAGELGGAGRISALSLFVSTPPGQTLSNWTIRLKPTALNTYAQPAWETNGWTTVYQRHEIVAEDGWVTFFFDAPFAHDGTNNLLADFSFNNSSYTSDGACRYFTASQPRAIYLQTDSAFGDPLAWSGTTRPPPTPTNRVPVIRFIIESPVAITPTNSGPFMGGIWTGRITVLEAATNLFLRALDPDGHAGVGNNFAVDSAADSNGNGLPDAWETRYFGSLNAPGGGADEDPDGDGLTNAQEYHAGTNPRNGGSGVRIHSVLLARGDAQIRFLSVAGRSYRVERATALGSANWTVIAEGLAGSGGVMQVTDPGAATQQNMFYRVRVVP